MPQKRIHLFLRILLAGGALAACSAASESHDRDLSADASAGHAEAIASPDALSPINSRFGAVFEAHDVPYAKLLDGFDRTAGMIEAHLVEAPAQLQGHYARVRLAEQADQGFTIRDVSSGVEARVVLHGALPVPAQIHDATVMYPRSHAGGDVIQRVTLGGTEDWLHFDESTSATDARYDVTLGEGVAGVRLVGDTFELLDAKGAPRVHMEPPFVLDAANERHLAHVGVTGCAYDSDPRGPWDRPVRSPGSSVCQVRVSWDENLARPLLVDPMWTTTASIGPRIVALNNGKVLGVDNGVTPKIYDPATWTAAATGSFIVARSVPSLTLLGSGKVLAVGSAPGNCVPKAACRTGEIYDPALGTWVYANGGNDLNVSNASLSFAYHSANLLSTGKVLLCGGELSQFGPTNTCSLYDPASDACSAAPSIVGARSRHTAVALANGNILIAGGQGAAGALASAAIYDSTANTWTSVNPMSQARAGPSGVRLASGKVLVCATSCEIFDPSTNGWTPTQTPEGQGAGGGNPPRTMVVLPSGRVIAGHGGSYDPATNQWSLDNAGLGTAFGGSLDPDGALLSSGLVYFSIQGVAELYDPNSTLGAACTTPSQCPGGNCIDGVCCQSACTFMCYACSAAAKGQGTNGTCGLVKGGLDPRNLCTDNGVATCQHNGFCDGAGACQLYATNTACGVTTCSNGTLTGAACSASHVCTPGSTSCSPYACANATICATSCIDDNACIASAWCQTSDHTCQPDKSNGGSCTAASQCISGNCVDGFCCDAPCAGACEACSAAKQGSGTDGTCGPVKAGTDPDAECPDDGAGSCKRDGFCSGSSGSCQQYPAGSSCGATSCASGVQTGFACNGLGTCNPSTTSNCAPYVCANASSCAANCNDDSGCVAADYCRVSDHSCQTDQVKGSVCTIASQCATGNCVDGFCCDSPCAGTCQACSNLKTGQSNGTCGPVKKATDPDGECPDDGPSSCGRNGTCDGVGACQQYAGGTACGTTTCATGTQTGYSCNGSGMCQPAQTSPCSPYLCNGQACGVTCGSDADCVAGAFCDGTSHCATDQANAAACTKDSQCTSGHCADGVCCDQACGGTCQACTKAKKGAGADGTCASIADETDPDNECAADALSSCKQNGNCDGKGGCKLYKAGTGCGANQCSGSTLTGQQCDGFGVCASSTLPAKCDPYTCLNDSSCGQSCSDDKGCVASYYCTGTGECVPKKNLADMCSTGRECKSTFCVEGVCCDTACNGVCQACSAAHKESGTDGTCANAKAGSDAHNDCTDEGALSCKHDGFCDGSGACRLYLNGAACGTTSCDNNTQTGHACDGTGVCQPNATVDCGLYVCSGGACTTKCRDSGDCATNAYCDPADEGTCQKKNANGAACKQPETCASGFCVDGVCCDQGCGGQCQACDLDTAKGTCSPIVGQPHGMRLTCTPGAEGDPCSARACDGAKDVATCVGFVGADVTCRSSQCDKGVETFSATCDGTGQCGMAGPAKTKVCDPYVCDATTNACKSMCKENVDCAPGSTCDAKSGKCVSGASCDGDHTVTAPNGQATDCSPYKCQGSTCRTACASVDECVSGLACDATGQCVAAASSAPADSGGCGCRVSPGGSSPRSYALLSLFGLLGLRRRRRFRATIPD